MSCPSRKRETDAGGRRSASFHTLPTPDLPMPILRRPDSHPELPSRLAGSPVSPERGDRGVGGQRLPKLLLNVTVLRSLGPLQVVVPPGSTVADLIRTAVEAYVREGRRPLLPETDPLAFELHYSQFSLESLNCKEKLIDLGSRNFFLCHKPRAPAADCRTDEAKKASKSLLRLA